MTGMVNGGARGALLLLAGLALAGCDSLGVPGGGGVGVPGAAAAGAATSASADVAAPEVFRVAEGGLWDGRPSLGGIWVAHPDVTDPERVRIVNTTNGQEVTGALFRRERDLPGPALQVSSDAAEALGMLAGAPAALEVTALRRQEQPALAAEPAAAEDETVAAAPEAEATETVRETAAEPATPVDAATLEAVAQATAAILAGAVPAAPAPASAIATSTLDSAPAAPAQVPAASALERPFVQIGTYEAEANARAVATQIVGQGLPVTVVEGQGSWRLLLGPATTEAQAAALLEGAVAAGFADAYLVAN